MHSSTWACIRDLFNHSRSRGAHKKRCSYNLCVASRSQGRLWAPQCGGGGEGGTPPGWAGEAECVRAPGNQREAPSVQVLHPAAGHPRGRIQHRVQRPPAPAGQPYAPQLAAGPQPGPSPSSPDGHRHHSLRPLPRGLGHGLGEGKVPAQRRPLQRQKGEQWRPQWRRRVHAAERRAPDSALVGAGVPTESRPDERTPRLWAGTGLRAQNRQHLQDQTVTG